MVYWKKGEELNNGKFIVEELLGSGGFGVTYKVKQTRTNKVFALKTLNELARSKPDFKQLQAKFINEAIALASCRHPNIVRVYPQDFQENELWCMVMEYVEGEDLAHYLDQKGKFDEQEAVEIITKVGNALSFVHQQGLLHRDIKPANILLRDSDLSPLLIDFGLAREYTSGTIRSMTNAMTECYAPIEQYENKGDFGAWTDVYALAATLYILVTKEVPLPSRFRVHAELPSPQQHNPDLSDRVNQAILKGMELEPANRPQSVQEWLELLKPPENIVILGGCPVTLQVFEFDTVKVNDRGEIIKTEHHSAKYFTEDLGNGISLDMVEIPGGTFLMGTEDEEIERLVKKYNGEWFKSESPHAYGLYDMHGNVWEWCADTWHDSYKGVPTDGIPWISESSNKHVVCRVHGTTFLITAAQRAAATLPAITVAALSVSVLSASPPGLHSPLLSCSFVLCPL